MYLLEYITISFIFICCLDFLFQTASNKRAICSAFSKLRFYLTRSTMLMVGIFQPEEAENILKEHPNTKLFFPLKQHVITLLSGCFNHCWNNIVPGFLQHKTGMTCSLIMLRQHVGTSVNNIGNGNGQPVVDSRQQVVNNVASTCAFLCV